MMVRVLLLDDERSVRRAFHLLLEEAGHEVGSASTVEEALMRLDEQVFDVAVIDMVMARDGGRRLLHTLRQRHPRVAVVAITGDPSIFAQLASDEQLDARLVKPFTRDVLLDSLSQALATRFLRDSQTRLRSDAVGAIPEKAHC